MAYWFFDRVAFAALRCFQCRQCGAAEYIYKLIVLAREPEPEGDRREPPKAISLPTGIVGEYKQIALRKWLYLDRYIQCRLPSWSLEK